MGKVGHHAVLLELPVGESQVEPAASGIKRNGADGAGGVEVLVHEASLKGYTAEGGGHLGSGWSGDGCHMGVMVVDVAGDCGAYVGGGVSLMM